MIHKGKIAVDKIVDSVNNLVQAIENYGYGQQLLFQGDFSGSGAVKRKRRAASTVFGMARQRSIKNTVKVYTFTVKRNGKMKKKSHR